jgi:phenylacetate-CoA ligase
MFTASCCRHLAQKGFPITVVTPGNNKPEILKVVRELAPYYEQTVLLGYPPFIRDVIDAGRDWPTLRLVLAGEVFSEEWRTLVGERAGLRRPLHDSASLYGTADAGVLGNETPLSIAIRRFLAARTADARALFGEARLPTLVQYDPATRFFEVTPEGTLLFSGDGGVPLVRYHISDRGGLLGFADMLDFLSARGFDPIEEVRREGGVPPRPLPFAWVFGRSHFAVSFYGANVFPEMVSLGLEQPGVREWSTGKFVMRVLEEPARFALAVELKAGEQASEARSRTAADAVRAQLVRLSSEFAGYVPAERQLPQVTLHANGDPEWFPVGVKHRYSR